MATTSDQMTLSQFIATHKITRTAERVSENPVMVDSRNMDHWKVKLTRLDGNKKRILTTIFSMGYGHHGAMPKVEDVLDCLASDVTGDSFADWCAELGFDVDSRKAERTYHAVQKQTAKLEAFLGDELLQTLLYGVER